MLIIDGQNKFDVFLMSEVSPHNRCKLYSPQCNHGIYLLSSLIQHSPVLRSVPVKNFNICIILAQARSPQFLPCPAQLQCDVRTISIPLTWLHPHSGPCTVYCWSAALWVRTRQEKMSSLRKLGTLIKLISWHTEITR